MKSLFWFIGLVLGALALMALIGLTLPREHTASVTARLAADPAAVFATLADPLHSHEWRGDIARVERLPPMDGKASFREYGDHGSVTYVVEELVPATRLVVAIDDDGLPFGGRWVYALAPEDGGTRITITEQGFVKNPVFRFLSHLVLSQTATMERYLSDLGAHFGEQVTPQPLAPHAADSHAADSQAADGQGA